MNTHSGIKFRGTLNRVVSAAVAVGVSAGLLVPMLVARPALADATFDQKMLELVNQQRAAAGVAPVQGSLLLDIIAGPGPYLGCGFAIGGRADDMGARNYFGHGILGCGNQSVFNILSSTVGLVYSAAAENIAWMNGTTDPLFAAQRLMNDLMNSPGHRANILDARFTHVGIGSWRTAAGQSWTGAGTPLNNVWITAQVFAQMQAPPTPAVTMSPTSAAFGDRAVGTTSGAQTVTVKNGGNASLNLTAITIGGTNGSDFAISSNGCGATVAAGASCNIALTFTPAQAGQRSATLNVSSNAAGSPHVVTLTGSGSVPPATLAPTNVTAKGGDGTISATWTAPSGGPAPVGYGVFVYDAAGYAGKGAWVCGTCTSATIAVPNGKEYFVGVYGHNGTTWGAGGASKAVWVVAVPQAPGDVQAVPGNGSMTVTWKAPTNPGTAIDGYAVYVYDGSTYIGKSAWVCATCTSATITGLANGTSRLALVYARNPNGTGPQAASTAVVVGTATAPGNVVAAKGTDSVNLSWTVASPNGAPILGYGAWVYDDAGYTGKSVWLSPTATTATIAGLTSGTRYTVMLHAYNDFGWGPAGRSNAVTL